jgi:hypothetical protein
MVSVHSPPPGLFQNLESETIVDFGELYRSAGALAPGYRVAKPFPHLVLENLVSVHHVANILAEIPPANDATAWTIAGDTASDTAGDKAGDGGLVHTGCLQSCWEEQPGATLRELVWELNSGTFLRFLENLSGIEGLIADPRLHGGGIRQLLPGGSVAVAAPERRHPRLGLYGRLGLHLYLNLDWPEEYGGELELWSRDPARCARALRPLAGRCVVFSIDGAPGLGYPRPLACPGGSSSKYLALYYFTRDPQ